MSATPRNALVLIAVVLAGAALYWMRSILGPPVLACFLLRVPDGLARSLARAPFKLSAKASTPAAIALVTLAFAGSVWIVIDGFAGFAARLPALTGRLDELMTQAARVLNLHAAPT